MDKGNGLSKVAKFIAMSFVYVGQGFGRRIAAIANVPYKALKSIGELRLWESEYDNEAHFTVRDAVVGIGATGAVMFGGFKTFGRLNVASSINDDLGSQLPVASAAPFESECDMVPMLSSDQVAILRSTFDVPGEACQLEATPNVPKLLASMQRGTGNIDQTQSG